MNWEYFIENGNFKAKRLPATRGSVKIKDCTDLYDLRDYLKEVSGIDESIEAYEHCFSDPYMYEVEVETFEEFFNRNPNKFLGGSSKLKGKYELIEELIEWDEEEQSYGWLTIDAALGKQLEKYKLAEVKDNIDENDWVEYLSNNYRVKDMKALGEKHSVQLKGTKSIIARALFNSIQSGLINHDKPYLIRPGGNLEQWFNDLQVKFVNIIEAALSEGDYPTPYIGAVWDMVLTDNSEHEAIVNQIKEQHYLHLPEDDFDYKRHTESKNDNNDFTITVTTTYSGTNENHAPKKIDVAGTNIEFNYTNRDDEHTTRTVSVNSAWNNDGLIYFKGHCKLRNELRTFRLDGVEGNMLNTESGEIIAPHELKNITEFRDFIASVPKTRIKKASSKQDHEKSNIGTVLFLVALVLVLLFVFL